MDERLCVTLYYFPQDQMLGDVDNIVKLTLDAMVPNVYTDDRLIDRVVAQRFDPDTAFSFVEPSDKLVEAMTIDGPVLHIRIQEVPLRDIAQ